MAKAVFSANKAAAVVTDKEAGVDAEVIVGAEADAGGGAVEDAEAEGDVEVVDAEECDAGGFRVEIWKGPKIFVWSLKTQPRNGFLDEFLKQRAL